MVHLRAFLCSLLYALATHSVDGFRAGGDVMLMTDSSFKADVKSHARTLVFFYAPWCGHCTKFKPEFDTVATKLTVAVGFGAVDCTTETALAKQFDIKQFPTLIYFEDGLQTTTAFDGKRTAVGVEQWLAGAEKKDNTKKKDEPKPADVPWASQGDAKDIAFLDARSFPVEIKANKHSFVMFYAPWCEYSQAMRPAFGQLATGLKQDDVMIGAVNCIKTPRACRTGQMKITKFPTIFYFKNGVKADADFDTEDDLKTPVTMVKYLNEEGRMAGSLDSAVKQLTPKPPATFGPGVDDSSVVHTSESSFEAVIGATDHAFVFFHSPTKCGPHCVLIAPEFAKAAAQLKGHVTFAAIDVSESALMTKYEIRYLPGLYLFSNGQRQQMFPGHSTRNAEDFAGWLRDVGAFTPEKKEL